MFTLKIRWRCHVNTTTQGPLVTTSGDVQLTSDPVEYTQMISSLEDESVHFISGTRVTVQGIRGIDASPGVVGVWGEGDYADYRSYEVVEADGTSERRYGFGHLVQVDKPDGESEWYLVSEAWLLGPDGQTIERLAP